MPEVVLHPEILAKVKVELNSVIGEKRMIEESDISKLLKYALIIVKFWAITRDSSIWNDPESFEPERFLGNNINIYGQHSQLDSYMNGTSL